MSERGIFEDIAVPTTSPGSASTLPTTMLGSTKLSAGSIRNTAVAVEHEEQKSGI